MTTRFHAAACLSGAAGLAAATALPRTSQAEWRPTEAVRIIIPAAPGGTTDLMGRLLGQHLQVAWGQSTVVENKSGGGGTIAMSDFVRQKPDGHTIMIGNPGPNAVAYSIFRNMTYKPDQLQPVSNMIRTPNIVSVHPSVPVKSIGELIAYVKANPDKLSYATSGVGQSPHLTAAWFLQLTGLTMPHVPFRGAGPALAAVLGGQVPMLFDNLYPSLPQEREGKLRGLATTQQRSFQAPETFRPWRRARRSLPSSTCRPGSACSCRAACRSRCSTRSTPRSRCSSTRDDTQARIKDIGAIADYTTPAQYTAFVQDEIEKFGEIIAKEKLQMDVN